MTMTFQDTGITIAAMDATANNVPNGYYIEGYPTIMFIAANRKRSPQSYDGSRDVKGMVDYINRHRSTKKLQTSDL